MNVIKYINKGVLQGFGLLFFVGVLGISYASISTVNTGDNLSSTKWNELAGQVNQNTTNISTNTAKLTNITSNGNNVGIGVATPSTKLDIDSGDIKLGGNKVKVYIGSASQTSDLSVNNQTWTTFPGATKTFNLLTAKTVKLNAYGSVFANGGSTNTTFCGFRFYIDGVGYGNTSWGDQITGCDNPTAGVGWWCAWKLVREIDLGAGSHTVSVQMKDWQSTTPACFSSLQDYSKARLFIEAW